MLPILRVNRNIRTIRRYRTILGVLIKYGFGHFVEQLNIDYYLELGKRIVTRDRMPKELERFSQPQRLRLAMEELGPTYIKLGQILSSRPDLVSVEFVNEFAKLQDKVPPFEFQAFKTTVESELGRDMDILFAQVDSQPLASASIGQVHRARLHDGDEVVIKVRRPGIEKIVEVDLEIMLHLATLAERHIEELAFYQPVKIVEEFARR